MRPEHFTRTGCRRGSSVVVFALGVCLLLAACGGPSLRQAKSDFERVYPGSAVIEMKPSELDLSGYTYTVAFRRGGDPQVMYAEFSYAQDKDGKWMPREEVPEEPGTATHGRARWRRDDGTTRPRGMRGGMMGMRRPRSGYSTGTAGAAGTGGITTATAILSAWRDQAPRR